MERESQGNPYCQHDLMIDKRTYSVILISMDGNVCVSLLLHKWSSKPSLEVCVCVCVCT